MPSPPPPPPPSASAAAHSSADAGSGADSAAYVVPLPLPPLAEPDEPTLASAPLDDPTAAAQTADRLPLAQHVPSAQPPAAASSAPEETAASVSAAAVPPPPPSSDPAAAPADSALAAPAASVMRDAASPAQSRAAPQANPQAPPLPGVPQDAPPAAGSMDLDPQSTVADADARDGAQRQAAAEAALPATSASAPGKAESSQASAQASTQLQDAAIEAPAASTGAPGVQAEANRGDGPALDASRVSEGSAPMEAKVRELASAAGPQASEPSGAEIKAAPPAAAEGLSPAGSRVKPEIAESTASAAPAVTPAPKQTSEAPSVDARTPAPAASGAAPARSALSPPAPRTSRSSVAPSTPAAASTAQPRALPPSRTPQPVQPAAAARPLADQQLQSPAAMSSHASAQQQQARRAAEQRERERLQREREDAPLRRQQELEREHARELQAAQARESEEARLLWLSLPSNDHHTYYSDTSASSSPRSSPQPTGSRSQVMQVGFLTQPSRAEAGSDDEDEERQRHDHSNRTGNRGNKLKRKEGARWVRRGKLGSWTEARGEKEIDDRVRLRIASLQRAGVRSLLASAPSPHLSLPPPPPPAPRDEPLLTSVALAPALLRPVLSARALLESHTLRHTFRNPHIGALSKTALDLRESEGVLGRALGRCFAELERYDVGFGSAEVGEGKMTLGASETKPAETNGDESKHSNPGAGPSRHVIDADAIGAEGTGLTADELNPSFARLDELFVTPAGLPIPLGSDPATIGEMHVEGQPAPAQAVLTVGQQRDVVRAALDCLHELGADSREYVERLDEVRGRLAAIKRERAKVWEALRLWALKREREDEEERNGVDAPLPTSSARDEPAASALSNGAADDRPNGKPAKKKARAAAA